MKIPLDLDLVENLVEWMEGKKRVLQGKDPEPFRRLIDKQVERTKTGIGQIKGLIQWNFK